MQTDEIQRMRILEIFDRPASEHSLKPHEQSELTALEAILFEKNDRLYFRCSVRNKDILAKPEEAVRQLWILRLTKQYGYPIGRLAVEYPITFGRDTSKRADIVIFDADRPTVPYTIVEVKQTKLKDGKEQLRSYTHATGAPIALWSDGAQTIVWHRKNPNYFVELPALRQQAKRLTTFQASPGRSKRWSKKKRSVSGREQKRVLYEI
jgi:type I restriction enzyme M protein